MFDLIRPIRPPHRIYQHLHFKGPFTTYLGFRMEARGEAVENELYWNGGWERQSLRSWCELAGKANVILDIGANTGVYALAAKAANPGARVIAFEPVARVAQRLRGNVALNGFDIEVEEIAASDSTGTALIHDMESDFNCSASLEQCHAFNTVSYSVPTVALDDYLESRGWPAVDLIKIDVESHEPAVFRGMAKTIARFRPTILVEVLTEETGRQLELPGYSCFAIDEDQGPIPIDRPGPLGGRNWNNLLVPAVQPV